MPPMVYLLELLEMKTEVNRVGCPKWKKMRALIK